MSDALVARGYRNSPNRLSNQGYSPSKQNGQSPTAKKGKKTSVPQAYFPAEPGLVVFDREFEDLPEPLRTQVQMMVDQRVEYLTLQQTSAFKDQYWNEIAQERQAQYEKFAEKYKEEMGEEAFTMPPFDINDKSAKRKSAKSKKNGNDTT